MYSWCFQKNCLSASASCLNRPCATAMTCTLQSKTCWKSWIGNNSNMDIRKCHSCLHELLCTILRQYSALDTRPCFRMLCDVGIYLMRCLSVIDALLHFSVNWIVEACRLSSILLPCEMRWWGSEVTRAELSAVAL